jgi:hypothetical protein
MPYVRAGWDWTSVRSYLDRFDRKVAVNGELVVEDGRHTGATPGWAVRLSGA